MKKLLLVSLFVLASACVPPSRTASNPNDVPQQPQPPPNPSLGVFPDKVPQDNFDRAGVVIGDSMRYVWNTSKGAYEWVTAEEQQRRMHEAYEAAKEKAARVMEAAKKTYEENKPKENTTK